MHLVTRTRTTQIHLAAQTQVLVLPFLRTFDLASWRYSYCSSPSYFAAQTQKPMSPMRTCLTRSQHSSDRWRQQVAHNSPERLLRGPVRLLRGPVRLLRGPLRLLRGPLRLLRGPLRLLQPQRGRQNSRLHPPHRCGNPWLQLLDPK